ncbi:MAG: YccS family putative transporter, partial [Halomonas sp.]
PVAKRIGELLGQIAERLNQRQPVEALTDQTAELLAQLEVQKVVSTDEQAIALYRPIQSQLCLIAAQLAPLGESANRLVGSVTPTPSGANA